MASVKDPEAIAITSQVEATQLGAIALAGKRASEWQLRKLIEKRKKEEEEERGTEEGSDKCINRVQGGGAFRVFQKVRRKNETVPFEAVVGSRPGLCGLGDLGGGIVVYLRL